MRRTDHLPVPSGERAETGRFNSIGFEVRDEAGPRNVLPNFDISYWGVASPPGLATTSPALASVCERSKHMRPRFAPDAFAALAFPTVGRVLAMAVAIVALSNASTLANNRRPRSRLNSDAGIGTGVAGGPLAPSSAAEAYVLQQIAKGAEADLNQIPSGMQPNPRTTVLRGEFIKRILTVTAGQYVVTPHGVQIRNADIDDDVDLKNREAPYDVQLIECHFYGFVDFTGSHFRRGLDLNGSTFVNADFSNISVAYDLSAQNDARLGVPGPASEGEEFSFTGGSVGGNVYFDDIQFESKPDFFTVTGICVGTWAAERRFIVEAMDIPCTAAWVGSVRT
jgi:hypothetical protein